MSSINLSKGQKIDLTKTNQGVNTYNVGLGWDVNNNVGANFDLDVSAFILNASNKLLSAKHLVYFGNQDSPCKSVIHGGDNLTGQGDGDDETLFVDFSKISPEVSSIVIVVNVYDAENRNQNFGQVVSAFIRICNGETKQEILRYDLSEDFSIETSVLFGRLYLKDGEWKFDAVGTGKKGGLQEYLTEYSA